MEPGEEPSQGRATAEGTRRFAARFTDLPGHYRQPDLLTVSSIGLGARRGAVGGVDDLLYRTALARSLERGINVVNTALSDRMQTSERALGAALQRAFLEKLAARDEVVIVSKGGQLIPEPTRATSQATAHRDLIETYVESGLVDPARVVNGFSIEPAFIRDQIERSRRNLGLATIDVYLIEEPEHHLRALGATDFRRSMLALFEALERAVVDGSIGAYGFSSWDGLLLPHSERGHLSILDLFDIALDAGSGDHHLRALQLPYGLAAGEGAVSSSQLGPDGRAAAALDLARDTGTWVMASAPLFGGRILGHVPSFVRDAFPEARNDAQCCLQFVRSTAGVHTAIVGMRDPDHVDDNLALAAAPPAAPETPQGLFAAAGDPNDG